MKPFVAITALLLSGCATPLVSSQSTVGEAPAEARLLGEYGLAQSIFTVTISAAGGDAGAKDGDKASTVTVNNNYTPSADKPDAAAGAKPDGGAKTTEATKTPESEAAWCAEVRKSYNQDRVVLLDFEQRHNDFKAKLRDWIRQGSFEAATGKDVLKAVDGYVAAKAKADLAFDRGTFNLRLIGKDRAGGENVKLGLDPNDPDVVGEPLCPQRFKVDIKETTEVDPRQAYRLYARIDNFSADHWVAEFDGGLPKSISGTADNKVGETLVAAAKSLGSIEALGVTPAVPVRATSGATDEFADALGAVRAHVDAANLQDLLDALPEPSQLPPIDVILPYQKAYTVGDVANRIEFVHPALPVALNVKCSPTSGTRGGPVHGIAISAARACEFTVLSALDTQRADVWAGKWDKWNSDKAKWDRDHPPARPEDSTFRDPTPGGFYPQDPPLVRTRVWAMDSNAVVTLPLDRTMLVKTATAYTFTAGRPTKADFDRPAPAMEVASLPFKVIGGFMGAVVDGIKGETGRVDAITARTKSETARIEAAAAYDKAKTAASPPPAAAPTP